MADLHRIGKKEVPRAAAVFEAAFRNDPVRKACLEGLSREKRRLYFECPARYCRRFGSLCAPSGNIEGCAGWVRSDLADMAFGRILASGLLLPSMKIGLKTMRNMGPVFRPLEEARRKEMGSVDYIYFMILGIAPEHQGKGHGGRLIRAVLAEADRRGFPVFLETATEKNVRMYGKFGFRLVHEVMLPVIGLPHWGMVRSK